MKHIVIISILIIFIGGCKKKSADPVLSLPPPIIEDNCKILTTGNFRDISISFKDSINQPNVYFEYNLDTRQCSGSRYSIRIDYRKIDTIISRKYITDSITIFCLNINNLVVKIDGVVKIPHQIEKLGVSKRWYYCKL